MTSVRRVRSKTMPTKPGGHYPTEEERDEKVAIPNDDPEAVLRAMLAVNPDDEPADDDEPVKDNSEEPL